MTHLTDKEIIKALDYCKDCCANINIDIIDLIDRQQAEIEKLEIENKLLRGAANSYKSHYNEAKAEAVKEFAERLKNESFQDEGYYCDIVLVDDIDSLLKEMAGETE